MCVNRQLIFHTIIPRLRRRQAEDDCELRDPLPEKLRSSVVRYVVLFVFCTTVLICFYMLVARYEV